MLRIVEFFRRNGVAATYNESIFSFSRRNEYPPAIQEIIDILRSDFVVGTDVTSVGVYFYMHIHRVEEINEALSNLRN